MFVACLSFQDNHSVLSSIILISVNEKNAPCFHFVKILIPKCRIYGNVMLNLKKKKIPAWYILQVQLTKTYIFIQGFSFIVKLNFLNRTRQTTVSCLITCTLASKQDINLSLVVFPRVKLAFFVNETWIHSPKKKNNLRLQIEKQTLHFLLSLTRNYYLPLITCKVCLF